MRVSAAVSRPTGRFLPWGRSLIPTLLLASLTWAGRPALAAEGAAFNPAGSDSRAIAAARSMLRALGGSAAWNKTRYMEFTFAGFRNDTILPGRHHRWDLATGRYRVEGMSRRLGKKFRIQFGNIEDSTSVAAWLDDQPVSGDSALAAWARTGYGTHINDSYWLLMPYKVMDPGVHLRWLGEQADSASGLNCEAIELSFDHVGLTPGDRYRLWIRPDNHLPQRWLYISGQDSTQTSANLFTGWKDTGTLKISTRRPMPGTRSGIALEAVITSESVNEASFGGAAAATQPGTATQPRRGTATQK